VLAGRGAGAKDLQCREAALMFLAQYRTSMRMFARMTVLDVARYQVHRLKSIGAVEGILQAAVRATPIHTLRTLTEVEGKAAATKKTVAGAKKAASPEVATAPAQRVFRSLPPTLTRVKGSMAETVVAALRPYAETLQPERRHFLDQYRPEDVAFKVVGTGSVGLRDYVVYMTGNGTRDPLFLQVKEEVASGYAKYVGRAARKGHEGRRVVNGERAMQVQSDPFLGWTTMEGRDYLVRQLNDHKASINLQQVKMTEMLEYAAVCGEILARGHARAGDSAIVAGYLGNSERFDDAVVRFAEAYANQTELDWKQLVKSLKKNGTKAAAKKS
jgi:uncharacterized protein (DUF2252 family)